MKSLSLLLALALSATASTPHAFAEDSKKLDFFEAGFAATVFDNDKKQLIAGATEAAKPQLDKGTETAKPAPDVADVTESADADLPLRDRLLSKYGAPDADLPVRVVENAPGPFKAVVEALNAGDEELAREYAVQWANYTAKFQRFSKQIGSLASDGMKESMKKDREALGPDDVESKAISQKADDIMRQAKEEGTQQVLNLSHEVMPRDPSILLSSEQIQAAIKKSGKVPVDPKGLVDVILFVDPSDPRSIEMGKKMEAVYRKVSKDKRVTVTALTVSTPLPGSVGDFKKRSGITIPFKEGSAIAKHLGVSQVPTIMVMSPTLMRGLIELGVQDTEYLYQLVKTMQGA